MMLIDREYFTEKEQKQMERLIKKALRRKEQHEKVLEGAEQCKQCQDSECGSECQSQFWQDTPDDYRITFPNEDEFYELERLLQNFCKFCLRFDLCQCIRHRERRKEAYYEELADDPLTAELPF